MNDNPGRFSLYGESPLYQLFVSVMIIIGVGFTLSLLLILAGTLIFGADPAVLNKSSEILTESDSVFLRYILIVQDISLLLIPSLIILILMRPGSSGGFTELRLPDYKEISLAVILAFCLFPVTGFTGQINSAMHLPSWLSGIEKWMVEKEENADNIIESILVSDTWWMMIVNVMVIAAIPSIAEEMIFRGVFQRIFSRLFNSGHYGVWFTAFIFSTIHFQFFGFVPRFILGLSFGYLFFWGGNLWLPVISHFVNNAFPVVISYTQGVEKLNAQGDIPLWKQAMLLPVPVAISIAILLYFRNKNKKPV